jgi:FkbM family methyltransferase
VGVYSAFALRRGAGRVIAIEPDPTNIACLEANLAPEIAAGQVNIVKAGVWHQKGYLTLSHSDEDSATHSFVNQLPHSSSIAGLPVLPLDEIVEQLKLARVDFIKMDIEGSERFALQGARQTITRFRPKMAICTYHIGDDVDVIPSVVRMTQPTYEIHAKDIELVRILGTRRIESRPKVLLFH